MPEKSPVGFASFAIAIPLYRVFDYDMAVNAPVQAGLRYRLPFGQGSKTGILLSTQDATDISPERIKTAIECLDDAPVLSEHMIALARWLAEYYLQPPGEVLFQCLPGYLRNAKRIKPTRVKYWYALPVADDLRERLRKRSPRQYELLVAIEQAPDGLNAAQLKAINAGWHSPVRALETRQAIKWGWLKPAVTSPVRQAAPVLNQEQSQVYTELSSRLDRFSVHLLDGITGSGKTEVYFRLIENQLEQQRQVIYLVPEIGLTTQLIERVKQRFGEQFVSSHSGLTDWQRFQAWDRFRRGEVNIMLGTRSCLFSQCDRLGLIVIDEEHDSSYRQEDGIRYHARDVAIKRAQMLDIPIVLGSATPSLESLNNCQREHYYLYRLLHRPTAYAPPRLRLIDTRQVKLVSGCSPVVLDRIGRHLSQGGQVLVYLNRRGYAPVVMCHECGWQANCRQCDSRLTLHQSVSQMLCHHCGYTQGLPAVCPECSHGDIKHYGIGTEQLEQGLKQRFSQFPVIRIDRDSVTSRDEFAHRIGKLQNGEPCLLIGTQMIAKGHDYPGITLSVILDADQALFSASYRASERLVQTAFQVGGRSGRGDREGEALIQTRFPEHPLMQALVNSHYRDIADSILQERKMLGFPPYSRVVIFRADALSLDQAMARLEQIGQYLQASVQKRDVKCIGPIPALMTRRIGRYRAQLCLMSNNIQQLRGVLREAMPAIKKIPSTHSVKWVIDVDAFDL
ncbi:MAG: primosomal protein N' [Gammaproteobacteria bacterium]